jgi:hypothetical protein
MKFYKSFRAIKALLQFEILITIVSCSATARPLHQPRDIPALTQRIRMWKLKIYHRCCISQQYIRNPAGNKFCDAGTGDTANRIDLSGDGHFMELEVQRVAAGLPFYEERRQGGLNNPTRQR